MDRLRAEAIARARAQIAERIGRLCRNLTPEQFDALLDRMAGIQCKYDYADRPAAETKRRDRPTDRFGR